MIDKKLIKKAIEAKSCLGWQGCAGCPAKDVMGEKSCFAKDYDGYRSILYGIRPRAIRIMQKWLDSQED